MTPEEIVQALPFISCTCHDVSGASIGQHDEYCEIAQVAALLRAEREAAVRRATRVFLRPGPVSALAIGQAIMDEEHLISPPG